MSFKVIPTERFQKEVKKIIRIYPGFKENIAALIQSLQEDAIQGAHLGHGIYKVRISIIGKASGKSYGARSIHAVFSVEREIFLLTVYDKSEKKDLTAKELKELVAFVKQLKF